MARSSVGIASRAAALVFADTVSWQMKPGMTGDGKLVSVLKPRMLKECDWMCGIRETGACGMTS